MNDKVTLALPSKGAISQPTLDFLREAGLKVSKPNDRQYTGTISRLSNVEVLFQRVKDVLYKVSEGTAQLGITGLDVVQENPHKEIVVIHPSLGYGQCSLTVAVPESWVDVDTIADLADVAYQFRNQQGRNLKVATTYTTSTRQFFHAHGIHHFTLVKAEGAIEVAPTIGYADIIVDLTQTGTTLRENHLKPLVDGVVIESQACLIGNLTALKTNPLVREMLRPMLEFIDASLQAKGQHQITVNMRGKDAESVARLVSENPITRGLQGPTISPIYTSNSKDHWYTVMIVVHSRDLLNAVDYLRNIGAMQVVVSPIQYVFMDNSTTYQQLLDRLQSL